MQFIPLYFYDIEYCDWVPSEAVTWLNGIFIGIDLFHSFFVIFLASYGQLSLFGSSLTGAGLKDSNINICFEKVFSRNSNIIGIDSQFIYDIFEIALSPYQHML